MEDLNEDYIPGWDAAPKKVMPPWEVIERAARGDISACTQIDQGAAKKLVEERELAYRYNECIMS